MTENGGVSSSSRRTAYPGSAISGPASDEVPVPGIRLPVLTADLLPSPQQPNPAANLTFNLELSAKEQAARAKLILPYAKSATEKAAHLGMEPSSTVGAGAGQVGREWGVGEEGLKWLGCTTHHFYPLYRPAKVFYQPDEDDDFDAEDPDDDLDI